MNSVARKEDPISTKNINSGSSSKYGALSARNILIRKKLAERKRFDSADHMMKTKQVPATTTSTTVVNPTSVAMSTDQPPLEGQSNQKSSLDTTKKKESKYGKLTAQNIIIRRKLAEKKKFDSADYQLQKLRHKRTDVESKEETEDNSCPVVKVIDLDKISLDLNNTPVPQTQQQQQNTYISPKEKGSKYGMLCARNILLRKKLSEKKRFDSADYSMNQQTSPKPDSLDTPVVENHAQPCSNASGQSQLANETLSRKLYRMKNFDSPEDVVNSTKSDLKHPLQSKVQDEQQVSSNNLASNSQCKNVLKHLKIHHHSSATTGGRMMDSRNASCSEDKKEITMDRNVSDVGKLSARSIILKKKLAEKKRFDSADYSMKTFAK